MSPNKKAALVRFARGLFYAALGTVIAYASVNVNIIEDVAPQAAVLVPIVSALLLAADKYVRAHSGSQDEV